MHQRQQGAVRGSDLIPHSFANRCICKDLHSNANRRPKQHFYYVPPKWQRRARITLPTRRSTLLFFTPLRQREKRRKYAGIGRRLFPDAVYIY